MTIQKAGTELAYTITYLAMLARPETGWPHLPPGSTASLLRADAPPLWYFFALYDAVGRDHAWEDMHQRSTEEVEAWLVGTRLYTLIDKGVPEGFFMLEHADDGVTNLAFFGMLPEAAGRGLGSWLLKTAILTGWDIAGTRRMTVNTCTLDHPRALALYQKNGFQPVRREERTRVLAKDRDLSRIPT